MGLIMTGGTGNDAAVDSNLNLQVTEGLSAHPAAGGFYSACGGPTAIVAAALAIDTSLVSMRLAVASIRKAYITKLRVIITPATLGAAAGVAGQIAWQRIATATPTGGVARTPGELNEPLATASDMTDVRDNNAALTVTSVTFGAEIIRAVVPLFTTGGVFDWETELHAPLYPIVLQPGDGLVLRTRVQLAATQTWVYSWTAQWYEK